MSLLFYLRLYKLGIMPINYESIYGYNMQKSYGISKSIEPMILLYGKMQI